jgi:type II secretory ATPase GspE/PulE/Tfp pilus assembly ATPase PilB-like protein
MAPQPADVLRTLIAAQRITLADGDRAVQLARSTRNPLGVVVDRLGLISQTDWALATADLAELPCLRLNDFPSRLPKPERLLPSFLKARTIAPLLIEPDHCRFAVADPGDAFAIKALHLAMRVPIDLVVAPFRDIETALDAVHDDAQSGTASLALNHDQQDTDHLLELANHAPTIKLVDTIFATALEKGATDIHLERFDRTARLRLRIDGVLIEQSEVPVDLYAAVISRIKILAQLDIAERRLPQDGRIRQRTHGREFDVRVATIPTIHGEAIALRILKHSQKLDRLEDLAIPETVRQQLEWGLGQRNGLLLVTGPTGSGKTTTLHTALAAVNDIGRKIISVENPVEIQVPGIIQVQANPEIGLNFAHVLRTLLRHDPDVLMVGEIRDLETAQVAIQAALTGHLVLSTLHTNDAPSAVTRLTDMGIEPFLIDATLRLSLAQRLVRRLCRHCAVPAASHDRTRQALASYAHVLPAGLQQEPRQSVGCAQCNATGFAGRQALFEVVSAHLGPIPSRHTGSIEGTLFHHALMECAHGVTTIDEVLRVLEVPNPS